MGRIIYRLTELLFQLAFVWSALAERLVGCVFRLPLDRDRGAPSGEVALALPDASSVWVVERAELGAVLGQVMVALEGGFERVEILWLLRRAEELRVGRRAGRVFQVSYRGLRAELQMELFRSRREEVEILWRADRPIIVALERATGFRGGGSERLVAFGARGVGD